MSGCWVGWDDSGWRMCSVHESMVDVSSLGTESERCEFARMRVAEVRIADALALLNHRTEANGCQCLAHRIARVLRGES